MTIALAQIDVLDSLATQGVIPVGLPADQAGSFFKTELAKHAALVKQSGATAD